MRVDMATGEILDVEAEVGGCAGARSAHGQTDAFACPPLLTGGKVQTQAGR